MKRIFVCVLQEGSTVKPVYNEHVGAAKNVR